MGRIVGTEREPSKEGLKRGAAFMRSGAPKSRECSSETDGFSLLTVPDRPGKVRGNTSKL